MYPSSSNRRMTTDDHEERIGWLVGRQRYAEDQRQVSFGVRRKNVIFHDCRLNTVSMNWIWHVK